MKNNEKSSPKKHNRGGARVGSGRKRLQVTPTDRELVRTLAGRGLPIDQMGRLICGGIDEVTLRKYFKDDIIAGQGEANDKVAKFLFDKASGQKGDDGSAVTAAIFWAKVRMKWQEVQKLEHSGMDGNPIAVATIDTSKMSTKALQELLNAKKSEDS